MNKPGVDAGAPGLARPLGSSEFYFRTEPDDAVAGLLAEIAARFDEAGNDPEVAAAPVRVRVIEVGRIGETRGIGSGNNGRQVESDLLAANLVPEDGLHRTRRI